MSNPTVSWDETSPAGSQAVSLGDNRIREMKSQMREIIEIDHVMSSSGQGATWGNHKQITFVEAADIGTGASGVPILGAQTVSGKPELVYTDEDDNDIRITSGGKLRSGLLDIASIAAGDLFIYNGTVMARLGIGTAGQVLTVNSGATAPEYQTAAYSLAGATKNLVIIRPTAATVDIDADAIVLENSSGIKYTASSVNLTADITASGANGLDTGAEGNVWYYIWVIYNGTTVSSLLSASSTAPTMPGAYTYKALVGAVKNTSSDFVDFIQIGKYVTFQTLTKVLSAVTNASFTDVDISAYVPVALTTRALLNCHITGTGGASSGTAYFRVNGVTVDHSGDVSLADFSITNNNSTSIALNGQIIQDLDSAGIFEEKNTNGTLTVAVRGYIINKL